MNITAFIRKLAGLPRPHPAVPARRGATPPPAPKGERGKRPGRNLAVVGACFSGLEPLEGRVLLSSSLPALSGAGQAIIDGSPTPTSTNATDFGAVILDSTPVDQTYTITNNGDATLTLAKPSVPAGFTLAAPPALSVAVNASTTFTVGLTTAKAGVFAGNVSFSNNDKAENPFTFKITGTVDLPALPAIGALSNSGPVTMGSQLTFTASDVTIPTPGTIKTVSFYVDTLGTGVFNAAKDRLVGIGKLTSADTYTLTIATAALAGTPGLPEITHTASGNITFFARALDNFGRLSSVAETSATILDSVPFITHFSTTPANPGAGLKVTLTATGVGDKYNTATSVSFYWVYNDTNELLGTTTAKLGWRLTTTLPTATDPSTPFPTSGAATFLAQAVDASGTLSSPITSLTENVNVPPAITALTTTPAGTVERNGALKVSAAVTQPGDTITKVAFYLGAIGATSLDTTTAKLLGDGGVSAGVYSVTYKVPLILPLGTYPIFAVATNSHGAQSNIAAVSVSVIAVPPTVASQTTSTKTIAANNPITLKANGVSDIDGHVAQVNFYWVYVGNGTRTNILIGSANAAQGYTLAATLPTTSNTNNPFPTAGQVTFLAQAVDTGNGTASAGAALVKTVVAPGSLGVSGDGTGITPGETTPNSTDFTDFGYAPLVAENGDITRTYTINNTGSAPLVLTGGNQRVSITGDAVRATSW